MKGKRIFISHATRDSEIINAFVDLILHGGLSVSIDDIFCVSTDGTKIKSGEDWRNSIKDNLLSADINFLIITPYYKESEVCLNEMGAAWVTSATVLPLIIEPINYNTVGVIQQPKQIEKLLDESSLDRIKDIVQEKLNIPISQIKSDRWTAKKKEFLIRTNKHLSLNTYPKPIERAAFNQLLVEKVELEKTIESLVQDKMELEVLVKELKAAKDKNEVKKILDKHNSTNDFDEFKELCKAVKIKLSKHASIFNGIIYKSYSRKEITISLDGNKEEIDEAFANDFIDEDFDILWERTNSMRKLQEVLDAVYNFIEKNLTNEDFIAAYEEAYEAPLDINNKLFWEEVFDVSISFK